MTAHSFLLNHGYITIFMGLLVEYLGLPIPGELILVFFGALVYWGKIELWIVLATGLAAMLLADHIWFFAGQRGGKKWLKVMCRATLGSSQCMSRTEHFFQKYGPASLLFAKFLPGIRLFAMPMAGMTGIPYQRFLLFGSLGSLLWLSAAVGAGMLMATQFGATVVRIQRTAGMLVLIFALVTLTVLIKRFMKRRKYGAPMTESRPHVG